MSERQLIPRSKAQAPFFAGVDVGGTFIKIGLVDDQGRTLAYRRISTDSEKGAEDACRRMGQTVKELIAEAQLTPADIVHVGLGTPGTMDIPAGMLLKPHNLGPSWFNFPIRDRLSHYCAMPVTYVNDAKAAAYGEFWVGRGRLWRSMVLFTLGTGVGCGIIIDELNVMGEHSAGGECGHMIIDYHDDARLCPCGQTGHLEAYASATAVIKRTQEKLDAGWKSSLSARLEKGEELTPLLIAQEAENGDALSLEIILDTARFVGIGTVNLMHTVDPAGVAIGGGMTFGGNDSELGRRFLGRIQEEVHRRAFPVLASETVIDFAQLGGDAGYIGAAGEARREAKK